MILALSLFSFTNEEFKQIIKNHESYEQGYFTFEGKIVKRYDINSSYSIFTEYNDKYDIYSGNLVMVAPRLLEHKNLLKELFRHDDIVQVKDVQFIGVVRKENLWGDYILIPYFEFTEESTIVSLK